MNQNKQQILVNNAVVIFLNYAHFYASVCESMYTRFIPSNL